MTADLAPRVSPSLPPVLAGSLTPEVRGRVGDFYLSVAAIFEAWVGRRKSEHTRRAYSPFVPWGHEPRDAQQLRGVVPARVLRLVRIASA